MAKGKLWFVRNDDAAQWYILLHGDQPCKPKVGWCRTHRRFVDEFCPETFERYMPQCFHLKPGGGPVEIKFAKEPA